MVKLPPPIASICSPVVPAEKRKSPMLAVGLKSVDVITTWGSTCPTVRVELDDTDPDNASALDNPTTLISIARIPVRTARAILLEPNNGIEFRN
jgi:hypothetical protein